MSLVLVVTVVVFIVSEKVTEIDDEIETEVSESEGKVDETVGGVVSEVELSVVWLGIEESPTSSFFSPHENVKKKDIIIVIRRNFIVSVFKLKYITYNNSLHINTKYTPQ